MFTLLYRELRVVNSCTGYLHTYIFIARTYLLSEKSSSLVIHTPHHTPHQHTLSLHIYGNRLSESSPPHRVARRTTFLSKSKKKILFGAYIYALKAFETKKQTTIRIYCRLPFIIENETRIYYLSEYIYIMRYLLFLRRGRVAIKSVFVRHNFHILQETDYRHNLHIDNIDIIFTDITIVVT